MTSLNLAPFWRRRTTRSIKRNVEYRKSSGMVDKKERGDRFQGMSIEGEGKIKGRKRWKWWVDAFRNAFQFSRDSSLSSFPFLARLDWLFRYIKHFLGVASLHNPFCWISTNDSVSFVAMKAMKFGLDERYLYTCGLLKYDFHAIID